MDKIQIPVVESSLEAAGVLRTLGEWLKDSMIQEPEGVDVYRYAWRNFSLCLLDYRRGRYAEAKSRGTLSLSGGKDGLFSFIRME